MTGNIEPQEGNRKQVHPSLLSWVCCSPHHIHPYTHTPWDHQAKLYSNIPPSDNIHWDSGYCALLANKSTSWPLVFSCQWRYSGFLNLMRLVLWIDREEDKGKGVREMILSLLSRVTLNNRRNEKCEKTSVNNGKWDNNQKILKLTIAIDYCNYWLLQKTYSNDDDGRKLMEMDDLLILMLW